MIEFRHLEHALALRDHRSFRAAARAIHLSQPALTRSIQSLEERVGVKLFERSRRAVLPTADGLQFLDKASAVLRDARALESLCGGTGANASGEVAVGAGPYAAELILGRVVVEMIASHPQARLRVHLDDWLNCVQRVRARDLDFCVAETSQMSDSSDLVVDTLARHQGYFAVRAGHPLLRAPVREISQIFVHPVIIPTRLPARLTVPFSLEAAGSTRPFPAAVCDPPSLIRGIIRESDAVAAMPLPLMERELREGTLCVIPLALEWLRTQYGIIRLKDRDLSPVCREAISCIQRKDREVTERERELAELFVLPGGPERDCRGLA